MKAPTKGKRAHSMCAKKHRLQNDHHDLTIMVPFDKPLEFKCVERQMVTLLRVLETKIEHYFQDELSEEGLATFKDRLSDVNRVTIMHGDNHFKFLLDNPPTVYPWGIEFDISPMSKFLIQ